MYIYNRQFSGFPFQRTEQPIALWPSRYYNLAEASPTATFSPEFRVMTTPVFKTIPVTLETLRGPQSKGGPQILDTENPFTDIATLEGLPPRPVTVGTPPENVEFSIGQALLSMQVFR